MSSLLLALLLAGCTPSEPETPAKAPATNQGAQAARAKQMKAAKARRLRAQKMRAKAGKGPGAGPGAGGPPKRIGVAGPMKGELVLTSQGEGDAQKTRAQLRMAWEGGRHTAFLGVTPGSCEQKEPQEVASGVAATWWSTCSWKEMTADFAVLTSGGMLLVQRRLTKDGKQGEWTTVRRVPLAEGAELTAGEVPPAEKPEGESAAPSEPSEAPAAEEPVEEPAAEEPAEEPAGE